MTKDPVIYHPSDTRENNKELRENALYKLGNRCSSPGCTWTHPDVLQIDHITPCALRSDRGTSYNTLRRIVKMTHPETEFQLLCANHHRLKTVKDLEEIVELRAIEREERKALKESDAMRDECLLRG